MLDSGNLAVYVKFFGEVLPFAFPLDTVRPMQAASYNCGNPQGAWLWIKYRVKEHLADLAVLDSIIGTFSPVLCWIARCHKHLYISPSARE